MYLLYDSASLVLRKPYIYFITLTSHPLNYSNVVSLALLQLYLSCFILSLSPCVTPTVNSFFYFNYTSFKSFKCKISSITPTMYPLYICITLHHMNNFNSVSLCLQSGYYKKICNTGTCGICNIIINHVHKDTVDNGLLNLILFSPLGYITLYFILII